MLLSLAMNWGCRIAARLKAAVAPGDAQAAHGALIQADIARFLARPYPQLKPDDPPTLPPGAPIGSGAGNSGTWGSVDDAWCASPGNERPAPFFAPLVGSGGR